MGQKQKSHFAEKDQGKDIIQQCEIILCPNNFYAGKDINIYCL